MYLDTFFSPKTHYYISLIFQLVCHFARNATFEGETLCVCVCVCVYCLSILFSLHSRFSYLSLPHDFELPPSSLDLSPYSNGSYLFPVKLFLCASYHPSNCCLLCVQII